MAEICLGILNEYVQHLFAICQQISLNSGFRENDRLTARNPSSHIRSFTSESPALERQKRCCGHDRAFSFDLIFFRLEDSEDRRKISESSILGQIGLFALELLVLERQNFFPQTYNGENVVNTKALSFLSQLL